jgi:hypothetical protein
MERYWNPKRITRPRKLQYMMRGRRGNCNVEQQQQQIFLPLLNNQKKQQEEMNRTPG